MVESFLTWKFSTSPLLAALELVVAYLFFSRVAKQRLPHWGVLLMGLVGVLGQGVLIFGLYDTGEPWVISYVLILLVLGLVGFRINVWAAALSAVFLTVVRVGMSIAAYEARAWLYQKNPYYIYTLDGCAQEMEAAVAFVGYLLCALVVANLIAWVRKRRTLPLPLFALPGAVLVGIPAAAVWLGCEYLEREQRQALALGSILLAGVSVLSILAYQLLWEQKREQILERQKEEQLRMEQSYYEILERQNQQLRSYAHDAKNHLEAIRNLNQDPKVEQYIAQMEQQLQAYTRRCHSGNRALDVMVDKYVTACELKNIAFTYDVQLCNLGSVEDFDLVAILGNLLDNALTAAQESQEKWVELATALRNGYQVVVVENSCDRPPIVGEEGLRSTKAGGEGHGFGLKSVAKALKKYEGDFQWDYDPEKRRFTMTVMIGQRAGARGVELVKGL